MVKEFDEVVFSFSAISEIVYPSLYNCQALYEAVATVNWAGMPSFFFPLRFPLPPRDFTFAAETGSGSEVSLILLFLNRFLRASFVSEVAIAFFFGI